MDDQLAVDRKAASPPSRDLARSSQRGGAVTLSKTEVQRELMDYRDALENLSYEMKTDENGCRLIVRVLGCVAGEGQEQRHFDQVYDKLGLDPATEPSLAYVDTLEFLREHCARERLDGKRAEEWDAKVHLKIDTVFADS